MTSYLKIVILFLCSFCGLAPAIQAAVQADALTMIRSALQWYQEWMTDETTSEAQSCTGIYSENALHLSCLPLDVVLTVKVNRDGSCFIRLMRQGAGMPNPVSANVQNRPLPRSLRRCVGLPKTGAEFPMEFSPASRSTNLPLSLSARAAATRYLRHFPTECSGRFPLIRDGDPFFHVYVQCNGVLQYILEFRISNGIPEDFSHWDYPAKVFPQGYRKRLETKSLWLPQ